MGLDTLRVKHDKEKLCHSCTVVLNDNYYYYAIHIHEPAHKSLVLNSLSSIKYSADIACANAKTSLSRRYTEYGCR